MEPERREYPGVAPPPTHTPDYSSVVSDPKIYPGGHSVKDCQAFLQDIQKGKNYDCKDNGRAVDAGYSQGCIDDALASADFNVERNWGPNGHCEGGRSPPNDEDNNDDSGDDTEGDDTEDDDTEDNDTEDDVELYPEVQYPEVNDPFVSIDMPDSYEGHDLKQLKNYLLGEVSKNFVLKHRKFKIATVWKGKIQLLLFMLHART